MDETRFKRSDIMFATVSQVLGADLGDFFTLSQLSHRQGVNNEFIFKLLPESVKKEIKLDEVDSVLADILYKGYISSQRSVSDRVNAFDNLKVPEGFVFNKLSSLSHEMIERLERAQPQNFGQLRRIPGLTPAAVSAVLVHLTGHKNTNKN